MASTAPHTPQPLQSGGDDTPPTDPGLATVDLKAESLTISPSESEGNSKLRVRVDGENTREKEPTPPNRANIGLETGPELEVEDEERFPEGGYGWVCVLASFLVHIVTIGVQAIYGVYQQFYTESQVFPGSSNLAIAFVGSVTQAGLPLFAIPAGRMADLFGYRLICFIGGVGILVSLVLASFATERGIATGLAVSGSGVGGLIMGPVTRILIEKLGWRWALRITGLGGGGLVIAAALLLRTRGQNARVVGVNRALFKVCSRDVDGDGSTSTFVLTLSAVTNPYPDLLYTSFHKKARKSKPPISPNALTPTPPAYGVSKGISRDRGALIVGLLNGASGVGRIMWGFGADFFGHVNTLFLTLTVATLSVFLIWPFASDFASLLIFGLVYGGFVGGYISLMPTVIAELFGKYGNLATTVGIIYSVCFGLY
ncbi:hypothetical protein HK102_005606 [Quaeritorhiza haematococci]|nr:hypothetical protein HK102_005606 [Quaeritorhiza haematococci]